MSAAESAGSTGAGGGSSETVGPRAFARPAAPPEDPPAAPPEDPAAGAPPATGDPGVDDVLRRLHDSRMRNPVRAADPAGGVPGPGRTLEAVGAGVGGGDAAGDRDPGDLGDHRESDTRESLEARRHRLEDAHRDLRGLLDAPAAEPTDPVAPVDPVGPVDPPAPDRG